MDKRNMRDHAQKLWVKMILGGNIAHIYRSIFIKGTMCKMSEIEI